jgi:hypothetical protein
MNRRTRVVTPGVCSLFLLLSGVVFAQVVNLGEARPKITTVSAVRVRTGPQFAEQEVTRLKLGAVVSAVARSAEQSEIGGKKDYWYRVRLPDGGEGWVFGGLLADYDPARRQEIVRRIIDERLKVESMSFEDGVDFYNFVSAALAEAKEQSARGELELARLHALGRAVATMPDDGGHARAPYRDFHKAHEREIYHHEFAGGWAVRPEAFWDLEAKYRGTPVGDRIAWDAAQALRPGECEGDFDRPDQRRCQCSGQGCVVAPTGAHAAEALQGIAQALSSEELAGIVRSRGGDQYAVEAREALMKALVELRPWVSKTTGPERAAILKRLDELIAAGR